MCYVLADFEPIGTFAVEFGDNGHSWFVYFDVPDVYKDHNLMLVHRYFSSPIYIQRPSPISLIDEQDKEEALELVEKYRTEIQKHIDNKIYVYC